MKHCLFSLAAAALLLSAGSAHGQAIPLATRPGLLQVGAGYSNGSTDELSKRISGASVYATFDFAQHLGAEADVHYLNFGTPQDFAEDEYLIGPRYVYRIRRYEPYLKVLVGIGQTKDQASYRVAPGTPGSYFAASFGGGLDIRLSHGINVRAVDFERQEWFGFPPNGLTPTVLTFGVAYRIR